MRALVRPATPAALVAGIVAFAGVGACRQPEQPRVPPEPTNPTNALSVRPVDVADASIVSDGGAPDDATLGPDVIQPLHAAIGPPRGARRPPSTSQTR